LARKSNYGIEQKLEVVNQYINGVRGVTELVREFGARKSTIHNWISIYERDGLLGFEARLHNATYTKEFKLSVVQECLDGIDSIRGLAHKHRIPSPSTILRWIKRYNGHEDFKDYDPKGAVYMATKRKTTLEERIEIVKYCLAHERAYKAAAENYNVAYSQVYSWVKKYEESGEEGLMDHRGHRKDKESLSKLERLQQENERLKPQLKLKERKTNPLKKVKEFERRRYSPKQNKNRST